MTNNKNKKPRQPITLNYRKLNLKRFTPLIGLFLFIAALVVLHRSAGNIRIHDIEEFINNLPYGRIWWALALVAVNFILFTGYDFMALKYIKKKLPISKVASTAMLGFSFSNVVGGMLLGGGSIRYRAYESEGLSALDILQVSLFIWMSWIVGIAAFTGISATVFPHILQALQWQYTPNLRWIGIPLCLIVVGYLIFTAQGQKTLLIRGIKWELPSFPQALGQIAIVGADLLISSFILYLLIPPETSISFPHFSAIFILALTISLFSGIPGGLGVFEVLMLHLLKKYMAVPDILGSLVVFRVIYYLIPLIIGTTILGANEARQWIRPLRPIGKLAANWSTHVIPQVFSLAVFIAGITMLITGTLPVTPAQQEWLSNVFPLGLFEISHFMASIVGLLLILFSHELQHKQRKAYTAVLILLALACIFESIKGHTLMALLVFGSLFLALIPCRKSFTRHSTIANKSFSTHWILTILIVMGAAGWLLFFNYRHINYANELWWQFSFAGNASRAIRATAGAMVLLLFIGLRRLIHAPLAKAHFPDETELEKIRTIIHNNPNPTAALALLRDKAIIFSSNQRSFLMYGIAKRIWVAMGDPVGDENDFPELIWNFREQCDQHGGRPVFYQISDKYMGLYIDAGFSFFKLGEEAVIPIKNYTLEGPKQAKLRYIYHKIQKTSHTFEIIPKEEIINNMSQLEKISNTWLTEKAGKEKKFSLGRFNEAYMQEFPVAVIRNPSGNIVAFANLWLGNGYTEFSSDLMRYLPGSPPGIMDYLFINLFLWGQKQGYESFNMGMAPLAGLETHRLGPLWMKIGVWIFQNGKHFYNFSGLRHYKDKFNPNWVPRYMASLNSTQLANELLGVTMLISGGHHKN